MQSENELNQNSSYHNEYQGQVYPIIEDQSQSQPMIPNSADRFEINRVNALNDRLINLHVSSLHQAFNTLPSNMLKNITDTIQHLLHLIKQETHKSNEMQANLKKHEYDNRRLIEKIQQLNQQITKSHQEKEVLNHRVKQAEKIQKEKIDKLIEEKEKILKEMKGLQNREMQFKNDLNKREKEKDALKDKMNKNDRLEFKNSFEIKQNFFHANHSKDHFNNTDPAQASLNALNADLIHQIEQNHQLLQSIFKDLKFIVSIFNEEEKMQTIKPQIILVGLQFHHKAKDLLKDYIHQIRMRMEICKMDPRFANNYDPKAIREQQNSRKIIERMQYILRQQQNINQLGKEVKMVELELMSGDLSSEKYETELSEMWTQANYFRSKRQQSESISAVDQNLPRDLKDKLMKDNLLNQELLKRLEQMQKIGLPRAQ